MATKKKPAPLPAAVRAVMGEVAARETFEAFLHGAISSDAKCILLEMARRRGRPANLAEVAQALKMSVGQVDQGCHVLVSKGFVVRGRSDVIALTPENTDLIDMLGRLASDDDDGGEEVDDVVDAA